MILENSKSYFECTKTGKIDFSQFEDLIEILSSLCNELKNIKWCEKIWCPLADSPKNHQRSLDFTKLQKYSDNQARILQYIYPEEYLNTVSIVCRNPIIEPSSNLLNSNVNEPNRKTFNIVLNQVIECFASKSIMDVLQYLNIASSNSNPPTIYNATFVNCQMGVINPLQENEVIILVQSEYKDFNFSLKNNDYISVVLKSKCLNENNVSTNKQAIIEVCKKLDKIVSF